MNSQQLIRQYWIGKMPIIKIKCQWPSLQNVLRSYKFWIQVFIHNINSQLISRTECLIAVAISITLDVNVSLQAQKRFSLAIFKRKMRDFFSWKNGSPLPFTNWTHLAKNAKMTWFLYTLTSNYIFLDRWAGQRFVAWMKENAFASISKPRIIPDFV